LSQSDTTLLSGGAGVSQSDTTLHSGGAGVSQSDITLHSGSPRVSQSDITLHSGGPRVSQSDITLHSGGPRVSQSDTTFYFLIQCWGIFAPCFIKRLPKRPISQLLGSKRQPRGTICLQKLFLKQNKRKFDFILDF